MIVHVEYYAQARDAAGCPDERMQLDAGSSLTQLIHRLAEKHGPRLASLLLTPDGSLARQVLFTVGDAQIAGDLLTPLSDGDRITIVPPISGG